MIPEKSVSVRLSEAVAAGDVTAFDTLLQSHPEEFRYDDGRCSWLSSAADEGQIAILQYLCDRGVDVNERKAAHKLVPEGVVVTAANRGHLEATRWLLDRGAILNHTVRGQVRCFALSGAASHGRVDIVQLLLERGAELNASWAEMTALDHAATYGHRDVYEYLRSVGGKTAAEVNPKVAAPPNKKRRGKI